MKAVEVDKALRQKFIDENARLVFWHDADGEFRDYILTGLPEEIGSVALLDVVKEGGLATKLRLELEEPAQKFLIYSTGEHPPAEQDWLLDIRLYSEQFEADMASIWLQEMGFAGLSIKNHLKQRSEFLGNQDRRRKLKRLVDSKDDQMAIDQKMMAVLVGSPISGAYEVLRGVCDIYAQEGSVELDAEPRILETFRKMGLLEGFWNLMGELFGYQDETPRISALLRRIFVSELLHMLGDAEISALKHLKLPASGSRNASVFLNQWRQMASAKSYGLTSKAILSDLSIKSHLHDIPLENLQEAFTFWEVEMFVVRGLRDQILNERGLVSVEEISELVKKRQAGPWFQVQHVDAERREALYCAYDAVVAAAQLFSMQASFGNFVFASPETLLLEYQDRFHVLDRMYRTFCTMAKPALQQNWDLLKSLSGEVEDAYIQGFLNPLGLEWSKHLDNGFLQKWSSDKFRPQQKFYSDQVSSHLAKSSQTKAFVIISDAFRYEAASELVEKLNGKYRMNADLSSMLGVLPSYTTLGMASLLPHQQLSYTDKGDVLVDGKATGTTEARNNVLAAVNGMACQWEDLQKMKQDEARQFVEDKRVVYIYHNVIDARGDQKATESETFEAVTDCIEELVAATQFCVNKLNASRVWITADHGFLFREGELGVTQKSALTQKPAQSIKEKKRYVIGRSLGNPKEAHQGSTEITAGTEDHMEFWIPRGANRFHFIGGARFTHGGAMPQEIVVPLVRVSTLTGAKKEQSKVEKVGVQLLGTNHKITTSKFRFEFIQTKPISDRHKPLKANVAIYENSKAVTSVEALTFDSSSEQLSDLKRKVLLELGPGPFDKKTAYQLILRDMENEAEVLSVPVVIDRSFTEDF